MKPDYLKMKDIMLNPILSCLLATSIFFFKSDPMPSIGEISNSRCMFSATFLPIDGKPVQMTMKFPNDLVWPGMYDNSTFFSVQDQFASHVDESGNAVVNDQRSVEYEKITPTRDSELYDNRS